MFTSIYTAGANVYSRLDIKSDHFDKVKLAADVQNYIQSVVKWGKGRHVNLNASKTKPIYINNLRDSFLLLINTADGNLLESYSLRFLGIIFSVDLNWKDYI